MTGQSKTQSAVEIAAGTLWGILTAQAILRLNGVDLPHALSWNLQIVATSAVSRFVLRRAFERLRGEP